MLKHIPIPTIPPPSSSTVVGSTTSASTTFATTPISRPSRPLLNRSQQPLNVSTLTNNTTTASNITANGGPLLQTYSNHQTHSYPETHAKPLQNGHAPRMFTPLPALSTNSQQFLLKNYNGNSHNTNNVCNTTSASSSSSKIIHPESNGAREALSSLGLLCLGRSSVTLDSFFGRHNYRLSLPLQFRFFLPFYH